MANQTIGTPMPANPQCGTCKTEQGLVRCPGCQVVFYCGREHHAADWSQHKQTCKPIKITRNTIAAEVDRMIAMPDSRMFRGRPIENSVKNRTAVQVALDHLLHMLRLNRCDNLGLRDLVPALYLRLGRDQACYDFVKWWYTRAQDDDYDMGNTDLPYLDIENADAFEPLGMLKINYAALPERAMLCLFKWRLRSDLQALKHASIAAGDKVPAELLNAIRSHMLSPAAKNNMSLLRDVENGRDIDGHIKRLEQQINALFDTLNESNQHYWAAVVEPARPPQYSLGSVEEMQLALAQTYDAWAETPGAIKWVRSKIIV